MKEARIFKEISQSKSARKGGRPKESEKSKPEARGEVEKSDVKRREINGSCLSTEPSSKGITVRNSLIINNNSASASLGLPEMENSFNLGFWYAIIDSVEFNEAAAYSSPNDQNFKRADNCQLEVPAMTFHFPPDKKSSAAKKSFLPSARKKAISLSLSQSTL